ncbi:hypothetical protein [Salmonella enterica]|uniref:hypothetical protein n=1 Tax=Salmonella enterica TaxID=28901 RepID=UPI00398C50DF
MAKGRTWSGRATAITEKGEKKGEEKKGGKKREKGAGRREKRGIRGVKEGTKKR